MVIILSVPNDDDDIKENRTADIKHVSRDLAKPSTPLFLGKERSPKPINDGRNGPCEEYDEKDIDEGNHGYRVNNELKRSKPSAGYRNVVSKHKV
jgi:hypothetical protein